MTKLKIKKSKLKEFLKNCSMECAYSFKSGKKTSKMFFESFFLDVNPDGKLVVLTLNKSRNTSAKFTLANVEVIEDGVIPITDPETIIKVLTGNSLGEDLEIESHDTIMTIKDEKTVIEVEQRESKNIEQLKESQIIKSLDIWSSTHEYNDDGVLVISKRHPMLKQDLPYPMRLIVKKEDLLPLIGVTLNLTKDNKTNIIFDGQFRAKSVQANSRIRLKDTKIGCSIGGEPFDFDYEFYSIQALLPNLFDKMEINIKTAKAKEDDVIKSYLNLYIVSQDPKLNMETIVAFSSIGKEVKSS